MLVCPRCNFHEKGEPALRLILCPRCQTVGKNVYLEAGRDFAIPASRRYDLFGLLASARAQLELSKSQVGRPTAGQPAVAAVGRQLEAGSRDPKSSISPVH